MKLARPSSATFAADVLTGSCHSLPVLTHDEIVAELIRRRDAGELRPRDLQQLLGLPSPRVAEILDRRRKLQYDEARAIVLHYGLNGASDWRLVLPRVLQVAGMSADDADLAVSIASTIVAQLRDDEAAAADPSLAARLLAPALWTQSRH